MSEQEEKVSEQGEKLAAIIPDFFFELISRIAPGFVVIVLSLYWAGSDFKAVVFTIGLSVFMLAAAWIIGVTLDVGVYSIGKILHLDKWLLRDPEGELSPVTEKVDTEEVEYDRWEYLRKASSWERGRIIKAEAQLIFFRNMMSVCALTAVICFISQRWLYGIFASVFGFFVFLPSWRTMRRTLRLEWKRLLYRRERLTLKNEM